MATEDGVAEAEGAAPTEAVAMLEAEGATGLVAVPEAPALTEEADANGAAAATG